LLSLETSCLSAAANDLSVDTTEGRYLLIGANDGTIYIYDLVKPCSASDVRTYSAPPLAHVTKSGGQAHKKSVESVLWLPSDSAIFATASADGKLVFWDANELSRADTYDMDSAIHCAHMSPLLAHQLVALGLQRYNHVRLVDPKSGSMVHELRGHSDGGVRVCRWSNRRPHLLATGGADGQVLLWDVRHGRNCLTTLNMANVSISSGRKRKREEKAKAHNGAANGLRFSADGLNLLSFGCDSRLRLWCVSTGRNRKAHFPTVKNAVRACRSFCVADGFVFVPEASDVLTFDENGLPTEANALRGGHYGDVTAVIASKQRQEVYTCGQDRSVLIWDADESRAEVWNDGQHDGTVEVGGQPRPNVLPLLEDAWSSDEDDE